MRRRNLILGLLVVAAMGTTHAQQSRKVYRVAVVHRSHRVATLTETSSSPVIGAIFTELRRLGYVEGKNILIERYSGEGRAAHYPDLARDVVRGSPDVIMAFSTSLTLDFKAATTTIPIVTVAPNIVETGVAQSMARPGGNITGASVDIGLEQWGKRLQLLKQMVPKATRLAGVESRENREGANAFELELCRMFGLTLVGSPLSRPIDETEYRRLFAALAQEGADEIIVNDEPENVTYHKLIIEPAYVSSRPEVDSVENSVFTPWISPTPLLMIVALADDLAWPDFALDAFNQAKEPKKLVLLPGDHFSPYEAEFSITGNEARDWFTRPLTMGGSVALNQIRLNGSIRPKLAFNERHSGSVPV